HRGAEAGVDDEAMLAVRCRPHEVVHGQAVVFVVAADEILSRMTVRHMSIADGVDFVRLDHLKCGMTSEANISMLRLASGSDITPNCSMVIRFSAPVWSRTRASFSRTVFGLPMMAVPSPVSSSIVCRGREPSAVRILRVFLSD